jgi:hypothetical protein
MRWVRRIVQPGFTTAAPPSAGCASGYIGPITTWADIYSTDRGKAADASSRGLGVSNKEGPIPNPCSRWRSLRSVAKQPQTRAMRWVRRIVQPGFTTAAPPSAGCASGYIGNDTSRHLLR